MQQVYSTAFAKMLSDILKVQRQEFNKGNTENSGASIDAMVVIKKLASHDRYRGHFAAYDILGEIEPYADMLKHAKPLTKFAQAGAYHVVRNAINNW